MSASLYKNGEGHFFEESKTNIDSNNEKLSQCHSDIIILDYRLVLSNIASPRYCYIFPKEFWLFAENLIFLHSWIFILFGNKWCLSLHVIYVLITCMVCRNKFCKIINIIWQCSVMWHWTAKLLFFECSFLSNYIKC